MASLPTEHLRQNLRGYLHGHRCFDVFLFDQVVDCRNMDLTWCQLADRLKLTGGIPRNVGFPKVPKVMVLRKAERELAVLKKESLKPSLQRLVS